MPPENNHLIAPLQENTPIDEGYEQLKAAHDYLARHAQPILRTWSDIPANADWGREVKRKAIQFKDGDRPKLISKHLKEHPLAEVVNQAATLERLLDVLWWAKSHPSQLLGLKTIFRCHPTTSSNKNDEDGDNDLILAGDIRFRACFEVSDVVGTKDSNGKLLKDLISLGVLQKGKGKTKLEINWPTDRLLFLVVSPQLAETLESRKSIWITEGHCHYQNVKLDGTDTKVYQICKGPRDENKAGDAAPFRVAPIQ